MLIQRFQDRTPRVVPLGFKRFGFTLHWFIKGLHCGDLEGNHLGWDLGGEFM